MLGKLIMIGGIGLLSGSFVIRRKQTFFKEFYDQVQRSQKFHLDFVDQLGKLPVGKNIILFGPPKSKTNTEKIICKTIISKGLIQSTNKQGEQKKQYEFPKEDRLWKFSLKEPFYLETLSNQKIEVEQDLSSQLYAFNLMRRNTDHKFQERVIVKNQPVCVYGKISNIDGKFVMKSKLIMGTKNQTFLTFLDNEILKLRSRSKALTFAGAGMFFTHVLYKQLYLSSDTLKKVQQKILDSSQKQILQQIKEFKQQKK